MSEIISILRSDENFKYLELLCYDCGKDIEMLSDFELFSLVCDNISKVYGSKLKKDLLSVVKPYCEDVYQLGDREVQKAIWRVLNGCNDTKINIAKSSHFEEIKPDILRSSDENKIDLDLLLRSGIDLPESIDDLVSDTCKGTSNIEIDMRELEYSRPDKYHTELTYQKLLLGESCEKSEISALIIWIICRVFMTKNARLVITPDMNLEYTQRLLGLLNERKLYPDIIIVVRDKEDASRAVCICRDSAQKNISSEIMISEEMSVDSIVDTIKLLICNLPTTRVIINGAQTSEETIKKAISIIQGAEEK